MTAPLQVDVAGVRWYVTVSLTDPEFDKVWFMVLVGIRLLEKPVTCADDPVAVHVKEVPVTFDVRLIAVPVLLHCDF